MEWVVEQGHDIIVPDIVVGELLVRVDPERHTDVLKQLGRDYRTVPFDTPAARKFAELRREHVIQHRLDDLNEDIPNATKAGLKADVMIIATALRYGADIIFSEDAKLRKMADGYIAALGFADVDFPRKLPFDFDDDE